MPALLIGVFAFGVSLLTLFTGFGLGTLLLPAFALVLPLEAAVASTAIVHAANNLFKAGLLVRGVDRGVVVRFGLPAVAASFGGALLLGVLSGQAPLFRWEPLGRPAEVTPIELVMGVLILVFSLFELVPALQALRAPPRYLWLGGLLSGFFGGLSGHQGALRAAFLLPLGLEPARFVATQAILALLVDGARLIVYGWTFVLLRDASEEVEIPWQLVAVVTAFAFAGAIVGARLVRKVTVDALRIVVGVLLAIIGVAIAAGLA